MWLHSLKVAQLLRSAAYLHTNQSRSCLNHLVISMYMRMRGHKAHICSEYIFLKLYFVSLVSRNNSIIHSLGTPTKQHFSQYIQKYLVK